MATETENTETAIQLIDAELEIGLQSNIVRRLAIVSVNTETNEIVETDILQSFAPLTTDNNTVEQKTLASMLIYQGFLKIVGGLIEVLKDTGFSGSETNNKSFFSNLVAAFVFLNYEKWTEVKTRTKTQKKSWSFNEETEEVEQKGSDIDFWIIDLKEKIDKNSDISTGKKTGIKLAITGIAALQDTAYELVLKMLGKTEADRSTKEADFYKQNEEKYKQLIKEAHGYLQAGIEMTPEFINEPIIAELMRDLAVFAEKFKNKE